MKKSFLTCEDVATRYGVKLTTVWAWIREGKLKALRIGKSYRIAEQALVEFEKASAAEPRE